MPTRRPPAGDAGGAAAGFFPNVAGGNPPLMGLNIHDEFLRLGSAGDYGDTRLTLSTIGSAPTPSHITPTSNTEAGILRLTTGTVSANEGGTLNVPTAVYAAGPSVGAKFIVKIRAVDTTDVEIWAGFASSVTGGVDTGDSTEFIGVRAIGSGDWEYVVKDGASSENVGELTDEASLTADWWIFGFHFIEAQSKTEAYFGVQFYRIDSDRNGDPIWTEVGEVITTNIPTATLYLVPLAIISQTGTTKAAEIDWYSLGGRTRR